jgi:hypothetical protein
MNGYLHWYILSLYGTDKVTPSRREISLGLVYTRTEPPTLSNSA